MERRSFLTSLGLGALAAIAPSAVRPPGQRLVKLQQSPVAGFQYHAGEAVWPLLQEDAELSLVREPANPYDTRAVRIDWRGQKLGYLPRAENFAVSQMLDQGQPLKARIVGLAQDPNPWKRIRVEVMLRV